MVITMHDEDDLDDLRVDPTHFSVAKLTDPHDALEYWLSRPIAERLEQLERLRRINYGDAACDAPLQRVLEVVRLEDL